MCECVFLCCGKMVNNAPNLKHNYCELRSVPVYGLVVKNKTNIYRETSTVHFLWRPRDPRWDGLFSNLKPQLRDRPLRFILNITSLFFALIFLTF